MDKPINPVWQNYNRPWQNYNRPICRDCYYLKKHGDKNSSFDTYCSYREVNGKPKPPSPKGDGDHNCTGHRPYSKTIAYWKKRLGK